MYISRHRHIEIISPSSVCLPHFYMLSCLNNTVVPWISLVKMQWPHDWLVPTPVLGRSLHIGCKEFGKWLNWETKTETFSTCSRKSQNWKTGLLKNFRTQILGLWYICLICTDPEVACCLVCVFVFVVVVFLFVYNYFSTWDMVNLIQDLTFLTTAKLFCKFKEITNSNYHRPHSVDQSFHFLSFN